MTEQLRRSKRLKNKKRKPLSPVIAVSDNKPAVKKRKLNKNPKANTDPKKTKKKTKLIKQKSTKKNQKKKKKDVEKEDDNSTIIEILSINYFNTHHSVCNCPYTQICQILKANKTYKFIREPKSKNNPNMIGIYGVQTSDKVGYIKQWMADILAPLMDKNKMTILECRGDFNCHLFPNIKTNLSYDAFEKLPGIFAIKYGIGDDSEDSDDYW